MMMKVMTKVTKVMIVMTVTVTVIVIVIVKMIKKCKQYDVAQLMSSKQLTITHTKPAYLNLIHGP